MADRDRDTDDDVAVMELEPDAWHEEEDEGLYLDCPQCGSPAFLTDIVRNGRCTGYLGEDVEKEDAEDVGQFCTAKLALDLRWSDQP